MLQIKSNHQPACKVFLNGELFIDQKLPYNNCILEWSCKQKIEKIMVINTSKHPFKANGVKIRPGQTMYI